jgi:hypothetical protein
MDGTSRKAGTLNACLAGLGAVLAQIADAHQFG